MAALGQVWVYLPWVPLVPQPRYLWPGNWGDWKPLHVLQATLQYMKAELCHLLTWQQALQKAQAKWGVEAGKLMTWKASLCGVQKINLQKGSRIPAARAVPGDVLPLCTTRCPWHPFPATWGGLLTASGLGTANPSLHVFFKYTVFHISFIFLLLLTPLIGHLADSDAFYGATTQLSCWEEKIFLSLISTASSHSSDTGTRKHGDVVWEALPCPDTEVMWWKHGRALWKKWRGWYQRIIDTTVNVIVLWSWFLPPRCLVACLKICSHVKLLFDTSLWTRQESDCNCEPNLRFYNILCCCRKN